MATNNNFDCLKLYDSLEFESGSDSDYDDTTNISDNFQTKYITEQNMNDFFKFKQMSGINIVHINTRSLTKKLTEIETLLSNCNGKLTALAITETWLKGPSNDNIKLHGFNFISKSRSVKRGGGVGIFLNDDFNFILRDDLSRMLPYLECVFVEVPQENKRNLLIGSIYRPPNTDVSAFNAEFLNILVDINNQKMLNVCIAGDCNLDLLQTNHVDATSEFITNLLSHYYNPVIRSPTRITTKSATIIDNIFINCNSSYDGAIIYSDISDHLPVAIHIESKLSKNKTSNLITKRFLPQSKINEFNDALLLKSWLEVNQLSVNDDPSASYAKFIETYSELFEFYFPLKTLNLSHKMTPKTEWITSGLMKCCSKKRLLYKRYMKRRTPESKEKFISYRNKLKTVLKRAEREYYHVKFTSLKGDIRNTWKLLNTVINKNKKCVLAETFMKDGVLLSSKAEIADGFNQFFTNIGKEISSSVPTTNTHFSSYLSGSFLNSFAFNYTNVYEVLNIVSCLKYKTSAGFDCIPVSIMKASISCIVEPLVNIINSSFRCGIFPDQLKIAKICPVFKDGKHDSFQNYRPISVLPSFSKIFEKVAYQRIESYLNFKSIINDNQFGFRSNHSAYMAVLDLYEKVSRAIDNNEYVMGIFIDIRKAFDTVDHNILLKKLEHYGVRGMALQWFKSYLSNRKQFVYFNGVMSATTSVIYGVPQGSILGPLLFLIYINDIVKCSKILHLILFADDTNLTYSNLNFQVLVKTVNDELKKLSVWFEANKLSLNVKKTQIIIFGNKKITSNIETKIMFNNCVIEKVKQTKFLGIIVDENLTWKNHILHVSNKISRSIGVLNRVRYIFPTRTLHNLYYSMIHPHLLYCLIVWGNSNFTTINKLVCLQKKAMRIISNSGYRSSTTPIFKKLSILKLTDLYKLEISLYMFKCLHCLLPNVCNQNGPTLRPIMPQQTRANSILYNFIQPGCRTTVRERSLALQGPKLWNSLPCSSKEILSLNIFKNHIAKFTINAY